MVRKIFTSKWASHKFIGKSKCTLISRSLHTPTQWPQHVSINLQRTHLTVITFSHKCPIMCLSFSHSTKMSYIHTISQVIHTHTTRQQYGINYNTPIIILFFIICWPHHEVYVPFLSWLGFSTAFGLISCTAAKYCWHHKNIVDIRKSKCDMHMRKYATLISLLVRVFYCIWTNIRHSSQVLLTSQKASATCTCVNMLPYIG